MPDNTLEQPAPAEQPDVPAFEGNRLNPTPAAAVTASAGGGDAAVASNLDPTPTPGDEFARQAHEDAVEAMAARYEENDDSAAADRVRARYAVDSEKE